jgi:ABC-type Fe3+-hydroxamate transport system substrate-binding protein
MRLFLLFFLFLNFLFSENLRIVSLGPAITEDIYLLGKGDNIVGNTIYCNRPKEAKYKEKVGNVIDVNVEKIYSLKPDIVFATNLTNPKDVKKLKELGIRVEVFSYPKNFNQLCEQFLKIGEIIGERKKAEEIIKNVKKEIERIKEKTKNINRVKVLVQIGTKPLWVAGENTFIGDIVKFSGGDNIIKGEGGIYSIEEIIKKNPEVIIITSMGIDTEEEKKTWQKYKMIDAVKNNKIFVVDSDKICSPTPLTFLEVVKELYEILH